MILTDEMVEAIMKVAKRHDCLPTSVLKRAIFSYCTKYGGDDAVGEPDMTNVITLGDHQS